MSQEVVDFRKPGRVPDDIGQMLAQWQSSAREAVELRWGRCVQNGVGVGILAPAPLTGSDLRSLDQSSMTYRLDVKESGDPTLVVISRPLALALVGEMLGEKVDALPEDRGLTEIETTCLDFLIDELRMALQASQTLAAPRKLTVIGRARLKELYSQFPENVTNTEVGFKIELSCGAGLVRWVLPQDVTLDFVASFATNKTLNGEARKALERLLLTAPAVLKIRLGDSQVSLARLARLKPGDVIVLDKTIEEPLVAEFGGQRLFGGWGGRIGKQQAFQIGEVFDGQSDR